MERPTPDVPDMREKGRGGAASDRRLFMQLNVFTNCSYTSDLIDAAKRVGLDAVIYESQHDPRGAGLLTWSEDPADYIGKLREMMRSDGMQSVTQRHDLTMLGRTYTLGYEADLDEVLLKRPVRYASTVDWPWVVWYPLRRSGAFALLPREKQMEILKEHGTIGMAFGGADLGHDIRLSCFGLDQNDNDFVIGLMGKELAPLSKLVETMRKTTQTSTYIEKLGPFFVGKAVWRSQEVNA